MIPIHEILKTATQMEASDIHFEVFQPPIFRINGKLARGAEEVLQPEDITNIMKEVMSDHARKMFEEKLEADFSLEEEGIGRFRVNVFTTRGNPSLSLRLVRTEIPTFEELHLPSILKTQANAKDGIVLACGPSGCGKSTTMARLIQSINETVSKRVITVEDPIEFLFENQYSVILQREIGTDTLSFHQALRHVVRQDPDVVMIGEMRDAESFSAALTMAETGHLVLSTLHTDTASHSISRILNLFPVEERDVIRMSLAVNLRAVICQQLVPSVNGGQVPTVELMINTPMVRKVIENNTLEKLNDVIETDNDDGMHTFNQSLLQSVQSGLINRAEALANSPNPPALEMTLNGINLDENRRIVKTD